MDADISEELSMKDGVDLFKELDELTDELNQTLKELERRSYNKAWAERDYKVLARQKALIERNNGESVSFITQFLAGDEEVAERKTKRDIEEALYYTCQEKLNALKLQIRVISDQIDREWRLGNNHTPY